MPRKIYKDPPNVVTRSRAGQVAEKEEEDEFIGFSQVVQNPLIASTPLQRDPKGKFVSKNFSNAKRPTFSMERGQGMGGVLSMVKGHLRVVLLVPYKMLVQILQWLIFHHV